MVAADKALELDWAGCEGYWTGLLDYSLRVWANSCAEDLMNMLWIVTCSSAKVGLGSSVPRIHPFANIPSSKEHETVNLRPLRLWLEENRPWIGQAVISLFKKAEAL